MPITPFHLGPALITKPVLRKYFSLGIFTVVQILIDLETMWNIIRGELRLHTFLHTFLGALVVSLAVIVPGKYLLSWCYGVVGRFLKQTEVLRGRLDKELASITWAGAVSGAIIGGVTHVLFDSIVHRDMHPFAPFSELNPFLLPDSFDVVHILFLLAGIVGIGAWLVQIGLRHKCCS